mgnify:CR=1 FL=1
MKGFPKVLKTAQDVKNCKAMVDAGQLQATDLLEAIEAIENQNFIICPIRELSEDKKTVTVTYCNEAAAGAKVTAGGVTATVQSVEHIDGEPDGSGKTEKEKTKITLSRAIAASSETIKIANTPSVYETLGMTEEELEAAFQDNTKAVFGETIANPALVVLDFEKFAKAAHKHGVPFIVDNTFATPINCRPFEWGADVVTHSTTKYMDGHATCVGGAIVDSGNFDWAAYGDKFAGLTTPDETYHGIIYTEKFGKGAYITKATSQLMRDLGSIQSPQNAFLLNLGLESLHLRMPRHCENAIKMAEYLQGHEKVAWVNCPSLPGNKYYDLTQKYMPNGSCGVITFGLKGGREAAVKMMDKLKLVAIVTHVADARSCVLHPASHTHRQMNEQELIEAGVQPDLIRFSLGIENIEDLIADVKQALKD